MGRIMTITVIMVVMVIMIRNTATAIMAAAITEVTVADIRGADTMEDTEEDITEAMVEDTEVDTTEDTVAVTTAVTEVVTTDRIGRYELPIKFQRIHFYP